ncbi:hypothetical protein EC991_010631 [Linnemannia zychae]|nr:hypothetical protein EC991_010631 [Linnemannia zychae]
MSTDCTNSVDSMNVDMSNDETNNDETNSDRLTNEQKNDDIMTGAVDLPELLILVAHNITPQDLLQCVQVCRFWNQIFIPRLWHTIDDESLAWPRFLKRHRDKNNTNEGENNEDKGFVHHIFRKYGQFIQYLDLHYWITIRAAVSSNNSTNNARTGCHHLRYLRVTHSKANNRMTMTRRSLTPVSTPAGEEQEALIQTVWKLAQQNSATLEAFRIDQSFARPSHLTTSLASAREAMYNIIGTLSNLMELEIIDDKADFDKVFEVASPQLYYLRAPGWFQLTGNDGQLLHRTFTNIKAVELFQEMGLHAVFSLLRYLPNLESLLLTGGFNQEFFQNNKVEEMEARVRMDNTPNRSLRQLTLYNIQFMDTRIMKIILPWIPELREFSCDDLHLDMSEALASSCQHLEVVRELDTFGGNFDARSLRLTFDVVVPLLRGCPSLRVLDTVGQRIQGDTFIGQEFPCLGRLETFRCQIGGMYWLDDTSSRMLHRIITKKYMSEELEDQGPGSPEYDTDEEFRLFVEVNRNTSRYHRVYEQLSKMTKLRVLELGQEYRTEPDIFSTYRSTSNDADTDPDEDKIDYIELNLGYCWYRSPIEDTLDLRLASGFNLLETLKDLEVFGFEGVDYRMDRAEMDWMAVNWPKLKVMRGIHVDILPRVEPDAKRTELREYMQMLRPDVVHETLYKPRCVSRQ